MCNRSDCWSTKHSTNERLTKERLEAFRKNKTIRQFITSLDDEGNTTDDEDHQLFEALEDVIAHIVDVSTSTIDHEESMTGPIYSNLAHIDHPNHRVSFTATLQDASAIHALTGETPVSCYAEKLYGIMVDPGCARGSSGGREQYHEYCKVTSQRPEVDKSKSKHCQFGIGSKRSEGTETI